jgi:hypothetical protein
VSRQHLEECRFFLHRSSSIAAVRSGRLRFGDQIKFWPLVFSHDEKATSQDVTLSVRSSTLRIREVPSSRFAWFQVRTQVSSLEVISLEVIG